jgi:hypothetical protein
MPFYITTYNYPNKAISITTYKPTNTNPTTPDPLIPELIDYHTPDNDNITFFIHAENNPKTVHEFTHQLIQQTHKQPLTQYYDNTQHLDTNTDTPRETAYKAVYKHIETLNTPTETNTTIWKAVHTALNAYEQHTKGQTP